jgi:heptaprenyl diphosphate synthase
MTKRLRWWASDMVAVARGALPSSRALRRPSRIEPSEIHAVEACLHWLKEYIGQPHPQLGRNGDICPFVNTALRKQKMSFVLLEHIDTPNFGEIRSRVLYEAWRLPRRIGESDRFGELITTNLLFPKLTGEAGAVVHEVHTACKTSLMRRGVMLAAFYPGYAKPAIYNSEFQLYQAPFPVIVVRPMALHDIVFLDNNREGFSEYHRRYAARYASGKVSDEFGYPERFRQASERFQL